MSPLLVIVLVVLRTEPKAPHMLSTGSPYERQTFEPGPQYVDYTGLKLLVLLPQPPECQD